MIVDPFTAAQSRLVPVLVILITALSYLVLVLVIIMPVTVLKKL